MCSVQATYLNGKKNAKSIISKSKKWKTILNKTKLYAHRKHNFYNKVMKNNKINYIRINIFPDGGISRVRIFGKAI
jgi:allantoicase